MSDDDDLSLIARDELADDDVDEEIYEAPVNVDREIVYGDPSVDAQAYEYNGESDKMMMMMPVEMQNYAVATAPNEKPLPTYSAGGNNNINEANENGELDQGHYYGEQELDIDVEVVHTVTSSAQVDQDAVQIRQAFIFIACAYGSLVLGILFGFFTIFGGMISLAGAVAFGSIIYSRHRLSANIHLRRLAIAGCVVAAIGVILFILRIVYFFIVLFGVIAIYASDPDY
jgi:hypothetical protein